MTGTVRRNQEVMRRPVREGVSKGEEDGQKPPALQAGHPTNGRKAVWGVARPQGIEGLGMAGPHETLGSLWIPLSRTDLVIRLAQEKVGSHKNRNTVKICYRENGFDKILPTKNKCFSLLMTET
jgi:hypothetical protein